MTLLGSLLVALFVFIAAFAPARGAETTDAAAPPVADTVRFASGGNVSITDTDIGLLMAAGGTLTFTGATHDDVIAAGGTLNIDGTVGRNAIVAGGTIQVRGDVNGSLIAAGVDIVVERSGVIAGAMDAAARSVTVDGSVAGNARISAGTVTVSGRIDGSLEVAAGSLILAPGAVVDGSIRFRGPNRPEIDADATVNGSVDFIQSQASLGSGFGFALWFAPSLFMLGAGVLLAFPTFTVRAGERLRHMPARCSLVGLGVLAMTPIVTAALIVSVIGSALALALLFAYALLLCLGLVFSGFGLSRWIADRLGGRITGETARRLIAFAVVACGLALIGAIPLVGGYMLLVLLILGVGMMVVQLVAREPA